MLVILIVASFILDIDSKSYEKHATIFKRPDLENAFVYLLDQLEQALERTGNFERIKTACERTKQIPQDIRDEIKILKSLRDIINLLCKHNYCNWFEIRLLQLMADVSGDSETNYLIKLFSDHAYSRKVAAVKAFFMPKYIGSVLFKIVTFKLNKVPKDITLEQLQNTCQEMEDCIEVVNGEIIPIVEVDLDKCIEVKLVLPLHYYYHAYQMYVNNFYKLRHFHIRYIQVGSSSKVFATKVSTSRHAMLMLEEVSSLNPCML